MLPIFNSKVEVLCVIMIWYLLSVRVQYYLHLHADIPGAKHLSIHTADKIKPP